jgi:ankyrin repeat protein
VPRSIPAEALYDACVAGDTAAVSRLPSGGTQLNLSGPDFQHPASNTTPLIAAAASGHTDIMRMLLARAPNTAVDQMDMMNVTALLTAALYHNADTIRVLADYGADVNFLAPGQLRFTPLRCTVGPIQPGAPPRRPDPDGERGAAAVRALLRLGAGSSPQHHPQAGAGNPFF